MGYKCSECKKVFTARYNLRKHAKKFHLDKLDTIAPARLYKYQCQECGKHFNYLKDFNYHKKRHGTSGMNTEKPLTKHHCPLCRLEASKSDLVKHFEVDHNVHIHKDTFEFSSFAQFSAWKIQTEKNTKSQFIKQRGNASRNNIQTITYHCHRSGTFKSKSKGLRHLKSQGSVKMNSYCPAFMRVIIKQNHACQVSFINQHIGHESELGSLSLTLEEQDALASKIASEIPLANILDEVRNTLESSHLERAHLLTKQDLHNIEKSFNLESAVLHPDACLDAWVKDLQTSGCVLYYKPQDVRSVEHAQLRKEDFVLIIMNPSQEEVFRKYCSDYVCLDKTHGLNDNNLELHTILIVDDLREAFPCAYLISNTSNEDVMKLFFNYVKDRIGIPAASKIFMSDVAEAHYNAWQVIMGPPQFRLFCTWHVDHSWRENLSKVNGYEKQVIVYKYLRSMLQERDQGAFISLLNYFVLSITSDSDTKEFGEYFTNIFVKSIQSWAYCYRFNSGLNTNIRIEQMHHSIKYIYLNGVKVKRIDKAMHEIQKFIRNRLFNHLVILQKPKLPTKIKHLHAQHKTSEGLSTGSIIENELGWEIQTSPPHAFQAYTVEEGDPSCNCKLICTECNVCIHKYYCSCIDSCIKWNMCKHVHLVCTYLKENPQPTTGSNTLDDNDLHVDADFSSDEINHVPNSPDESQLDAVELAQRKEKLKSVVIPHLLQVIDGMMCIEQIEVFERLCAPIEPTLNDIREKLALRNQTSSREARTVHHKKLILLKNKNSRKPKKKKEDDACSRLVDPTLEEMQEIDLHVLLNLS